VLDAPEPLEELLLEPHPATTTIAVRAIRGMYLVIVILLDDFAGQGRTQWMRGS
jgi:hypothetical protein